MKIPISKIKLDAGTQVRCKVNQSVVNKYAERMTDGEVFKPVDLFFDGSLYHVADGWHRIHAAIQNDFKDIEATVHNGTREDALWFALAANRTHGLRMGREDVRKAIGMALRAFPDRSNKEISRQIGCDDKTVSAQRVEMERTAEIPKLERTVGADGKSRPATRKPIQVEDAEFPPKGGRVANAFIHSTDSPDGGEHWFMVQEDCRNPGFFYGVHIELGKTDNDGAIDFTMKPLRADAWTDSRISPLLGWLQNILAASRNGETTWEFNLKWTHTDELPDWVWAEYIEPNLPEGMAHLKRKKPVEVETAMQTAGGVEQ